MTSENEHRLFGHLIRLTSILTIIRLDHEHGHTTVALASNLAATRKYMAEHLPALWLFCDRCYRQQPIPEELSELAEHEAVFGRGFRQ